MTGGENIMNRGRKSGWVIAAVTVGILAMQATAAPVTGVFESEEFNGDIIDGRWTESYAGGGPGLAGNVLNAASWDGTTLGGQWTIGGMTLDENAQLIDLDTMGSLTIEKYFSQYVGGQMLLKKEARDGNSAWWGEPDGSAMEEYTVFIDEYTHHTQVTKLNGVEKGVYSLITMTGSFDPNTDSEYYYNVEFMLAVAVKTGEGAGPPAGFPDFLGDPNDNGQWGVAQKIRMEIAQGEEVPEPSAMALVAIGATAMILRRRRRTA